MIGRNLPTMIARGVMLGPDQPVTLHMLDIPSARMDLDRVEKGLTNAAHCLLEGVVVTSDIVEACTGVNIAIIIGDFTSSKGAGRKDETSKNFSKSVVLALGKHAAANCKVVIAANPGNTTALNFKRFAQSIPEKNITCLTRHDHNRTLGRLSKKLKVKVSDVKNVIIWGNRSSTQYPDVNHAMVNTPFGERLAREDAFVMCFDEEEFITGIKESHVVLMKGKNAASGFSAIAVSSAICDHVHDWIFGTAEGTWVSMAVFSDGSYNVPSGIIHSFPVTCRNGEWAIVQGLQNDEFSLKRMNQATEASIACHIQSQKRLYT